MNSQLEIELDPAICWQAMSARDRRFDGRFFAGVVTTKVYCRPICPIPLRKPENVTWFPSASSAEANGFRPCRRCRPHTSPGTPAWHGTVAVVSRALRLIEAGAMDHGNVEELAEHVGIGSRHLRRLFAEHLGAAPIQIANARRLRLARRLLTNSRLSVNQVAASAGFQSIRQFNHAIRSSFEKSPSEIRKAGNSDDAGMSGEELRLHLPFRAPVDWSAMLCLFREHGTAGIESVDDRCYRRTIQVGNAIGYIATTYDPNQRQLLLRVRLSRFDSLIHVAQRARRLFELGPDRPGLAVPGAWDAFELAVLAILGYRLGRAANSTAACLVRTFGEPIETSTVGLTHLFPSPGALAKANLASIDIKPSKADAIRALAAACHSQVAPTSFKAVLLLLAQIVAANGLSAATTLEYVAARATGEPDMFPVTERAVRPAFAD